MQTFETELDFGELGYHMCYLNFKTETDRLVLTSVNIELPNQKIIFDSTTHFTTLEVDLISLLNDEDKERLEHEHWNQYVDMLENPEPKEHWIKEGL